MELTSRSYPAITTYVYRLYDADDRLLYVGVAGDLEARFGTHAKRKSWWPSVVRREITEFSNRLAAMYEESRAIDEEAPVHNRRRGLHPIGLLVLRRTRGEYRWWHDTDGELIVSAFGKTSIARDIAANTVDALVAIDGCPQGVVMGVEEYLVACAALGVAPQDRKTARIIEMDSLVG